MTTAAALYRRHRAARIRAGTWQPRISGQAAREHLAGLRRTGATYEEIAAAAGGLSHATVRALEASAGDVRADTARRLMTVSAASLDPASAPAGGTAWRLRALTAVGHSPTRLAAEMGQRAPYFQRIVNGEVAEVPREVRRSVAGAYERLWDKTPAAVTAAERRAAALARTRAAAHGWCPPMGLDDDRLDQPGYRPRTPYQQAEGTGRAERELEMG